MSATDIENSALFCFQCEQTVQATGGCTKVGVCTKSPEVAGLQDHLVHGVQSLCSFAWRLSEEQFTPELAHLIAEAMFSTLTNVNFNPDDFLVLIARVAAMRDQVAALLPSDNRPTVPVAQWVPAKDKAGLLAQARDFLIPKRFAKIGKDRVCLQELIVYGLKGVSAYAHHAAVLGKDVRGVMRDAARLLGDVIQQPDPSVDNLLGACLETGAVNLRVMEILDAANTGAYGHPEPTQVDWVMADGSGAAPTPGKCVLVSGHDLMELERLLTQIEASEHADAIKVYTHGEMLPALAYPGLKKHRALVGHYGTAWQNQKKEFAAFPGPIVMTTNCYIPAPDSYVSRVFSCAPTGGIKVTPVGTDYSAVIASAIANPGFSAMPSCPGKKLTVGFAHNTVMGVAGTVIDAVKEGALRRIYLIGGCDGFEKERNMFTDFAAAVPDDCLILTLACGKFKVNNHNYGSFGTSGIPRLLDMGQCNDAYSAIQVAVALAKAFNCDVNSLPLSLIISWFEQKAVAILLTLLHLGIKNIFVGPRIPAFFTPTILGVLIEKFQLHVLSDVKKDLEFTLNLK